MYFSWQIFEKLLLMLMEEKDRKKDRAFCDPNRWFRDRRQISIWVNLAKLSGYWLVLHRTGQIEARPNQPNWGLAEPNLYYIWWIKMSHNLYPWTRLFSSHAYFQVSQFWNTPIFKSRLFWRMRLFSRKYGIHIWRSVSVSERKRTRVRK